VEEGEPVALDALKDEAFAAKEAGAQKAIVTFVPRAAQRNASFWAMTRPPQCRRSSGVILPGYGDANATSWRLFAALPKVVMKNESPARARLAPISSLPIRPLPDAFGSSVVCMTIPSSMYIMAPASAITISLGSRVMITACRSSPMSL
jgi:hypothetical protein